MFGWWEPFVAIGGVAFWMVAAVFSVFVILALETDSGTGATFVGALFILFLMVATPFNPVVWALTNPGTFVSYLAGYFAAGSVWSFLKWIFYVLRRREEARIARTEFKEKGLTGDFGDWVVGRSNYRDSHYPPQVSRHKSDLVFWATWWPWSAFWTLLNDPIRHIWNFLYNLFGRSLQNITNRMFEKV